MIETLAAHLEALERDLLTEATRRSRTRVEALLAPEFLEFGSSGRRFTRGEIVAELLTEVTQPCTLHDFALQQLSNTVALATYKTERVSRSDDTEPVRVLRSSVWVEREGRWQMIFHQGTRRAAPNV